MSPQKRIYWSLGILSVVLLASSFLVPGERPAQDDLPWHIEHPNPGSTRVLGLTLGESTPALAEQRFREKGEFALFRSTDGRLVAEAYFEQINLAGLRSKVVLTLIAPEAVLSAMHDRGLRASATASGRKITPATEDVHRLRNLPIGSLTLIPGIRVSDAMFEKRFGKPAQVIREANGTVTHRLYPQHALDIASSTSGSEKQVLQFVPARDYEQLVAPLVRAGGTFISP